ncbi:hypothetical protein M2137_001467 [Parabacteroides sp. PFB2-10]|uniref:hypothetical protein n=1 Tax=Parabacteroides sp. PFB2-10 TaxID=1742405 RepID=UPI0024765536|nr:hypothetical protein [Parabacteroides sp. PFB2-10]MDH6312692.1 hypothetical protein [Parabacteroides sp. PFB2-10]
MNANTTKVQSIIETTFISAIERLKREGSGSFVSDLYVQVDPESGEVQIYDENENLLDKVVIFDWINKSHQMESFQKQVIATLKAVLTVQSTKGMFEDPLFIKPVSVSLTNEYFVVVEELLFLDDDLFRLDDPLLKDLDAELDDFLNNLLSDIN